MSLRVWLPLTKDLRNQGLDDVTVTNNGATFNANGKLGGCYKTSNSGDIDLKYSGAQINTGSLSLCGWFKFNKAELAATWGSHSFDSTQPNPTGNLIGNNSYGGVGLIWSTNSLVSGAAFTSLYVACSIRSTINGARITSNITIPFDTWVHLALVFNKDTKALELWLNGELKVTNTMLDFNDAKTDNLKLNYRATWGGSNPSYNIPFLVNDVRIYDHALSPLEIKQISQGLILHYPLNRQGWGNNNILINSNFDLRYTQSSGWDTEKNGTQLANSWGGYNSGVSNSSTVYHAHLKELNGEWVYEYIKTANETWLGISQGGLNSKLTAGKTYTFSWEQYCVSGSNYVQTGLYYFKTGATSANFHLGLIYGNVGRELGKWQKFSRTFIAPEDGDYSKNMSWYIYGHMGNGIVYVRHPKLEESSKATPWSPSPLDTLATTLGLNDNVEYDTSGYGNNGEYYSYDSLGSIEYSSDSPKYNVCTFINSDNNTTSTPSGTRYLYGHCGLTHPTEMTVSFWCKPLGGYNGGANQGQFCTTNIEYGNTNAGYDYQDSAMNHRDGWVDMNDSSSATQCHPEITFIPNEWHHYTFTYDGQNGKSYRDGLLQNTKSFSVPKTLDSFIGVILGFSKAGGVWRSNKSYYSDFRIYATALSADDVKSLYNNSAYIDNQGNIYGAVYEEV